MANDKYDPNHFKLENFLASLLNIRNKQGAGIVIHVKFDLHYQTIEILDLEAVGLELDLNIRKFRIICFYNPPHHFKAERLETLLSKHKIS